MRRILTLCLLVGVWATSAAAQDVSSAFPSGTATGSADSVRIPSGAVTADHASGVREVRRVRDKRFWVLAGALNGAMLVDTHSTFTVLGRCADCRERNPLVAPFVNRGPALTYTAGELFDAGVMALSAKMRGSRSVWARRTWWVAPAALALTHGLAARHNYRLLK